MNHRIYSDETGKIFANWGEDMWPFGEPAHVGMVEYDEITNPALRDELNADWKNYSIEAGALLHNGQPVTINPDSPQIAAQKAALATWNALPDWMKTYTVAQATAYIDSQVFNGQDAATIKTSIANAITAAPNTVAGVKTVMNTLLGNAADAIIAEREIIKMMTQMLFILRDVTVRFTKFIIQALR